MRKLLLIFAALFVAVVTQGQDDYALHPAAAGSDSVAYEGGEAADTSVGGIDPRRMQTTRQYQEDAFTQRPFDETKWKDIVGDTRYVEAESQEQGTPSVPWAGPVLKVIAYVVILGAIGWLLYYLLRNTTFKLNIERTAIQADDPSQEVENIEGLDIAALLEQAKREGNFRLAIRFYYLALLKKLNALGMIGWKKDKTNSDYLTELFIKGFHYKEIQRLTILYEAVWYGEHSLKAASFLQLSEEFERAYEKVNNARVS